MASAPLPDQSFSDQDGEHSDWIQVPVLQSLTVLDGTMTIDTCENGELFQVNPTELVETVDDKTTRKRPGRPVTSERTRSMAANFIPVSEVREKLEVGDCFARARSGNSSSEVWSLFEEIAFSENHEFTGYVRCKLCSHVVKYHGQITGTSHMRRHACFIKTFPLAVVRAPQTETPTPTTKSKRKKTKLSNANRSLWEGFVEVIDIQSQESVGYLLCKRCKRIVKCETQKVNAHQCKPKDVEKNEDIGNNLMFRAKPKNRSTPVWEEFEEVIDPTSNNILGYVRCRNCREIFRASDPKSIPSVLRRHQTTCPNASNDMLNSSLAIQFPSTLPIAQSSSDRTPTKASTTSSTKSAVTQQNEIRDRCLQFCCSQLVNLNVINSSSFRQLAQSLVNLGANQGRSSLNLPDINQLTTQLETLYSMEKTVAKTMLSRALEHNVGGSLVLDQKTSDESQCILSFCHIDQSFNIVDTVLNASLSVKDTNSFITSTLNDYELLDSDVILSKFSLMSKGCVFGVSVCLTSIAHAIDLAVETTLAGYSQEIDSCHVVCSELKLEVSLDKEVEDITWIRNYESVRLALENQAKFQLKCMTFDLDKISLIVEVLKPFREASCELRKCRKRPTLNHVVLWYYKLLKMLNAGISSKEADAIIKEKTFKDLLKVNVEQYVQLHSLHKVAVFLWPNFRHLKMLPDDERLLVHEQVRDLLNSRFPESSDFGCPAKKARSDFSDWEDVNDTDEDEVNSYVSAMLTTCNEDNILSWWREHQADFPRLAALVKWVLCIPASTTSFEQFKLQASHSDVDNRLLFLRCVESKLTKQSKKRFTSMVKDKPLHSSFAKKMEIKLHAKIVKTEEDRMKAIKSAKLQAKNKRREQNRKRKEENTRKSEIVQKVKNVSKLKRKSKKEMKKLRKV